MVIASARRFLPPWTVDEINNACFIVRDKNGQQLGYFYDEQESSWPQRNLRHHSPNAMANGAKIAWSMLLGDSSSSQMNSIGAVDMSLTCLNTSCMCLVDEILYVLHFRRRQLGDNVSSVAIFASA